jgi:tRNA threonylcarbamoyladenosine biosynthesis protein TsaE
MQKQTLVTHSQHETQAFGVRLAQTMQSKCVVALSGDLGAGKTTFTQGVLEGLGAIPPYTSPTFVIMKQYDIDATNNATNNANNIQRVYHIDAYRIGSKEMLSLGWEEWLDDEQGVVLVEWSEHIADILPSTAQMIRLQWVSENERRIEVEGSKDK